MQKRLRRFLVLNWIPLTAGFYITAKAIEELYQIRGGAYFGSEWFITPALLGIWFLTAGIRKTVRKSIRYRIRKAARARQRKISRESGRKMEVA